MFGYNYFARPFANWNQRAGETVVMPEPEPEIPAPEAAYASLSPREKVTQMLAVPLVATESAPVSTEWLERENPGFLLIFGDQLRKSQITEVIAALRSLPKAQGKLLLPAIAVDHEGGEVQRLNGIGYTELPSWRELCAAEESERQELLQQSSWELAETGVNFVLAPMLDLAASNNILGSRVCGADVDLVASRSAEFSTEFMNKNILPVYKHFPGIGRATRDLHFNFTQVAVDDETSELYRNLLNSFPQAGVMVTHAGVSNSADPNTPCSLSPECVGALHRYFPLTLTFTDSLTMEAAFYSQAGEARQTLAEVSVQAVRAGNDVLLYDQAVSDEDLEMIVAALVTNYETDEDFARRVDDSVQKIILYKEFLNLIILE